MLFTKMQALGNDFVVIDATKTPFLLTAEQIQRMGDRRLGVGFDQLLVLEPARDLLTDFYYRIFNADGSEVGQCGNGARCIALYIKTQGLSHKDEIVLQTREVRLQCQVLSDGRVSVYMGEPKFAAEEIPFDPQQASSSAIELSVVNVGNPHAIIMVDDVDAIDLAALGVAFSNDRRFPQGVNVSVATIDSSHHVRLRVFERGAGETLACGSAACAVMAIGYQQGLLGQSAIVSQPGGDLELSWRGPHSPIEMIGPAMFVFRGEYQ